MRKTSQGESAAVVCYNSSLSHELFYACWKMISRKNNDNYNWLPSQGWRSVFSSKNPISSRPAKRARSGIEINPIWPQITLDLWWSKRYQLLYSFLNFSCVLPVLSYHSLHTSKVTICIVLRRDIFATVWHNAKINCRCNLKQPSWIHPILQITQQTKIFFNLLCSLVISSPDMMSKLKFVLLLSLKQDQKIGQGTFLR